MACLANHMMPGGLGADHQLRPIEFANCSSPVDDSYSRTHVPVPTHQPIWKRIPTDESGKQFEDIIYEKAAEEGIAKVCVQGLES